MKRFGFLLGLSVLVISVSGCCRTRVVSGGSYESVSYGMAADAGSGRGADTTPVRVDRMLIWKTHLTIQVWNVSNAVGQAIGQVEAQGGYVEKQSGDRDQSATLVLRIPATNFLSAESDLETLGTVTYRSLDASDVTESYVDIQARLKNKIMLRDRLQQLLEKANQVADILAIETELNRVQSDIDSMTARIEALEGQADFATLHLALNRKPIPGPLGYVFKGIWWGVSKLFVIRE